MDVLHESMDVNTMDNDMCEYDYVIIIWIKGFKHKNHQIQRLVLKTFLNRKWNELYLLKIEKEFIINHFIPVIISLNIFKKKKDDYDYEKNINTFLNKYISIISLKDKIWLIYGLIKLLNGSELTRNEICVYVEYFEFIIKDLNSNDNIFDEMETSNNIIRYEN